MSKQIKKLIISEIEDRLGDNRDFLVIDTSQLDAISTNRFRLSLQEQSIGALTVKNSLAKRALSNIGVTALDPCLEGPSTLVWGTEDVVTLSKEIARWTVELKKLEIKGGAVEGESLDADAVRVLSRSPGREELLSIIVGLALSPGSQLAGAVLGVGGRLAGQLETIAEGDDQDSSSESD